MLQVLDGFDVIKVEADIMKQSRVWTNLMSRHTESAIDRQTRSQELLHFCTDSEEERQWITVFTLTSQSKFLMCIFRVNELFWATDASPAVCVWEHAVDYSGWERLY